MYGFLLYSKAIIIRDLGRYGKNICSDLQGACTSLKSFDTPCTPEEIFLRVELALAKNTGLTVRQFLRMGYQPLLSAYKSLETEDTFT